MRKLRNSTFLHSLRSSPSLLKYKQFTSVLRLTLVFLHGPGSGATCLLRNLTRTQAYKNEFQLLPRQLAEKVATLHLIPPSWPRNTQVTWLSRLKALSRVTVTRSTTACRISRDFRSARGDPAQKKKSELRAHQMARNCGVPGSLRTKIHVQTLWISGLCHLGEPQNRQTHPRCERVTSRSAGYDCVNNATVRVGRA